MSKTMRPIDLLDAKDLSKLSTALQELRQVEVYKTLGSLSVTARTLPGGKTRTVAMIVQVRTSRPGRETVQNFECVEEIQREQAKIRLVGICQMDDPPVPSQRG